MNEQKDEKNSENTLQGSRFDRKSFLKYAGASAVAATTFGLVGCDDDDGPGPGSNAINLGSGDVGVLNFAYALEQLEAAFYIQVMDTPYSGMDSEEGQILQDLRDHEVVHRDWFAAAIGTVASDQIIPNLSVDFSMVDFTDRGSVLATAMALEDTGVGAYNGAARFIQDQDYLVQAGKIVSVEARHAAAIRDLINPNSASFAGDDIIDNDQGLDTVLNIDQVLQAAGPFIVDELDASNVGQ